MGQAPHAVRRPPCHSVASHTQAVSPYGVAVFPYGHTPDASPHTSWQIPIGRPFSHTPHQIPHSLAISPYGFRGSPYNPQTPKNSTPNSTRPAGPVPQIPNQPCQANILDLRHTSANQSPTGSGKSPALQSSKPSAGQVQQMLQTCDWGVPSPPARKAMVMRSSSRPWSRAHFQGHAHGHSHTFTGMRTATSTSGHASDETSVRLAQIKRQPSSLKCPAAASHLRGSTRPTGLLKTPGGHGRQRRRQRCDACDACDVRGPAPVLVRPEGRTCSRA